MAHTITQITQVLMAAKMKSFSGRAASRYGSGLKWAIARRGSDHAQKPYTMRAKRAELLY
ncbi:MAG: hypothetical protein DME44_06695 [Verrucomicrobia bacterium]|nr:MAG: hypothetical protein DME44_06695 [Verrucomicrobiota bacterium]